MGTFGEVLNGFTDVFSSLTGQQTQRDINEQNIEFQKERNAIEDARYAEETAYNRAFAEEERAYNRAFLKDERDYNRAFAADERAYQRNWAKNERDYQRSLQQTIFDREDTAIARQAEALRAQGINPASQNMNGLGTGSVVSSSSPGTSSPGSSVAPGSTSAPALSSRGGRALQKAMITSQGINGILSPILQTINTIDNLKGSGAQRDVINAQAMKTQAEAYMAILNMFNTANKLNISGFNFPYGKKMNKTLSFTIDPETFKPYTFTPQMLNDLEGKTKVHQYSIFGSDAKMKKYEANKLDSVGDSMTYLTEKLMNVGSDKLLDTFSAVVEEILLKALHLK